MSTGVLFVNGKRYGQPLPFLGSAEDSDLLGGLPYEAGPATYSASVDESASAIDDQSAIARRSVIQDEAATATDTSSATVFAPKRATVEELALHSNTALLLHGNGTNGSTTIVDSSQFPRSFTCNGAAEISTTQSKFSGASISLDGAHGTYLIDGAADPRLAFGSDPFTIRFWAWKPGDGVDGYDTLLATDPSEGSAVGGWFVELSDTRGFVMVANGAGVVYGCTTGDSTWHHYEIADDGATLRIFVDGVLLGSSASLGSIVATIPLTIWSIGPVSESYPFNGYVDDLQIIPGVCLHTSDFDVPPIQIPDHYATDTSSATINTPTVSVSIDEPTTATDTASATKTSPPTPAPVVQHGGGGRRPHKPAPKDPFVERLFRPYAPSEEPILEAIPTTTPPFVRASAPRALLKAIGQSVPVALAADLSDFRPNLPISVESDDDIPDEVAILAFL